MKDISKAEHLVESLEKAMAEMTAALMVYWKADLLVVWALMKVEMMAVQMVLMTVDKLVVGKVGLWVELKDR